MLQRSVSFKGDDKNKLFGTAEIEFRPNCNTRIMTARNLNESVPGICQVKMKKKPLAKVDKEITGSQVGLQRRKLSRRWGKRS